MITALFNFEEEKIIPYCLGLPDNRKGQCFANAASRMIETDWRNIDKSVKLCKTADESDVGDKCWDELVVYSTYNFHKDSEEQYNLCNQLPDPWKKTCLEN